MSRKLWLAMGVLLAASMVLTACPAPQVQTVEKRVDLYAQAEKILVNTGAAIAPIYWYTSVAVTKPYVQRTYGVWGQELFEKWDITR